MSPVRSPARRAHAVAVVALVALAGILAVTSLLGDSITYDEPTALSTGYSRLTGDGYHLTSGQPPLLGMWASLPLLLLRPRWPPVDTPAWGQRDALGVGRAWLFDLNDGERLIPFARGMVVVLLLATCVLTYAIARALFGRRAGLVALTLAALDPTLLAHGRLVTTDLAVTLCLLLTIVTFARAVAHPSAARLLGAAAAASALVLVKFSWPAVVPALASIAAVALVRRTQRPAVIVGIILALGVSAWLAVWSCYRWRYSAVAAGSDEPGLAWEPLLEKLPASGPAPALIHLARAHHLLPESYLYDFTFLVRYRQGRRAYLMGQYSDAGWWWYFPVAFALKTPIATVVLLVAGLIALAAGRAPPARDPLLLTGLASFALTYTLLALTTRVDIGHRHLVPLYPPLFVFAGAAAAWWNTRGRWLIAVALAWLLGAALSIHPHYLSYFNELAGGPSIGYCYLTESNLDWGQDLKRLARHLAGRPPETIKFAYFGSGDPTRYGFSSEMIAPSIAAGPLAALTAGTYVVSATELVGVYLPDARDDYWRSAENVRNYELLGLMLATSPRAGEDPGERATAARLYDDLRRARLINRLSHRRPDERVGYSLFIYHLTAADVDALTRP